MSTKIKKAVVHEVSPLLPAAYNRRIYVTGKICAWSERAKAMDCESDDDKKEKKRVKWDKSSG